MRRELTILAAAAALGLAAAGAPAGAQEKPSPTRLTSDHYFDLERLSDAQISPDGRRIVYARAHVDRLQDKWEDGLWIVDADGGDRYFAKGSAPRWSPDGKRILFVAEGEGGKPQVFVRRADGEGAATPVTHGSDAVADARWSPDGRSIAFTAFVENKPKWAISLPAEPQGAKWTAPPRIVQSLHYRQDRKGFVEAGVTRLFIVSAEGGAPRALTTGSWSVGAGELRNGVPYDFTPDGRRIVVQAARDFDNDLNYTRTQILVINVADGSAEELPLPKGGWTNPRVSPDGRTVAVAGFAEGPRTHTDSDLWLVALAGGEAHKLTEGFDRDPRNLKWAPDNSGVYFDFEDRGTRNIGFAPVRGSVRRVTSGEHVLSLDSASDGLVGAGTLSDPDHPAEVVRVDLRRGAEPQRVTAVNAGLLAGKTLGKTHELTWTSSGGVKVKGWYVTPPDFDASKKYPLILEIHGGPYGAYDAGFDYMWQNFAANGFVVLYLNPRGSTGFGQAFVDGIDHNYPGPDYDDLMSGVDAVQATGIVDPSRMYVSGCSGGGVLSSWVIGHTNRFAAAAVRCPVTDWMSMAGHTDIPMFTYSFFKKPFWEDPTEWLAHSTLMSVGKVTTPTLLMTGVLDRRTPMPQTEEYFAALKVRGVPTTLLQFEGEYHGTGSKPSNWMRTQLYMMSWFNRWARGADGKVVERAPEAPGGQTAAN